MKKLLLLLVGFLLAELTAATPNPPPDARVARIVERLGSDTELFGLQAPTGVTQASLIDFAGVGAGLSGCPSGNKARAFYDLGTGTFRVINSACVDIIGGGGSGAFPRLDQVTDPNFNRIFTATGLSWGSTGGTFDISGSQFIMPTADSTTCSVSTALNQLCLDSTNNNIVVWFSAAGKMAIFPDANTFTDGDMLGVQVVGNQILLKDLGPPAGGGGGGTVVTAVITNIQENQSLCWDTTLAQPNFVNCSAGVPVNLQTGTTYTFDGVNDRGTAIFSSNTNPQTYSMAAITDAGDFDSSWFAFQHNKNSGLVTVTTTAPSTFDDTGTQSTTLSEGQSCTFLTDTTGNGTLYPKCHEPRMTATSPIVFTRSPYGLGISCPTCAVGSGNLSGSLTSGKVPVASGATTLVDGSILDDLTHAARNDNGYDINSLGKFMWWIPNNTVTGTTLNKAVCDDGSNKGIICPFATSTTNNVLGSAVAANGAAPGTSGSTGVCTIGFCSWIMDNSATAGHYAQSSTTVAGDLSDVGATPPTNGQSYWYIFTGNAGAGTAAVIRNSTASELSASGVSGGNGRNNQIQVNGVATTKQVKNFNATTPAAAANNQNLAFQTSAAANTDSISVEVPLATTGQAGLVKLAGGLGGTSALPTLHTSHGLSFSIGDPAGSALTAGSTTTDYVTVPFACTIDAYNLNIDAGTITVKFWKIATGTAIPTSANSINTSGVGISSGTAIHSTTLSDFTTTTVTANDIMAMSVTVTATAKFVNGVLSCTE